MNGEIVRMGAKRLAVFAACVASIAVWPYVGWQLGWDFFFFAPQLAFPYRAIFTSDPYIQGSHVPTFSPDVAIWLTICQWFLIAALFAIATFRVRKTIYLILLSLGTITLMLIVTQPVIKLFGKTFFLDGP